MSAMENSSGRQPAREGSRKGATVFRRGFHGNGAAAGPGAGLLLLAWLAGCGYGQAEEAPTVQLTEVERRDLEITAEASGELEPVRTVEVKSKASGEVIEVHVDVGDRVDPGTLLTRIDPRDVQNDFAQAEADYEVAKERFSIAEAQLRRSENLLAADVITEQEHEGRRLEYVNARSNLVRSETSLELARLRLDDVTIRAPMTGVVLERLVEEGTVIQSAAQNVSGGTTLITIANLDRMRVRTLVDETDVGRIQPGMPVTVRVDAHSDRAFEGVVDKIEPMATVQQNVVMFPVIVHLDNEEGLLKPGMSAEVTVLTDRSLGALSLPNNAIVSFEEMAPAAQVLGVPEDRLSFDRSVFQQLGRELAAGRGGAAGGPAGGHTGDGDEARRTAAQDRVGDDDRQALRERMRGSGMSPEQLRERMEESGISRDEMRGRMGRSGGGSGRGAFGPPQGRPGVVFVQEADGTLRPRPVLLGVSDWSNSEILAGLEEGERVALIGGAQLQAAQQQRSQQIRMRMGGGLPF